TEGGGEGVNALDDSGSSPLHLAAAQGDHLAVRLLLDAGADVHMGDRNGRTPLHSACGYTASSEVGGRSDTVPSPLSPSVSHIGVGDMALSEEDRYSAVVSALLLAGADANALDTRGIPPLRLSMQCRRVPSVVDSCLLDCGAKIVINHHPLLHQAVSLGHTEWVALLLRHGAHIDREAVLCAIRSASCHPNADTVVMLLLQGARKQSVPPSPASTQGTPLARSGSLRSSLASSTTAHTSRASPLEQCLTHTLWAAYDMSQLSVARVLLAHGADPAERSVLGTGGQWTPDQEDTEESDSSSFGSACGTEDDSDDGEGLHIGVGQGVGGSFATSDSDERPFRLLLHSACERGEVAWVKTLLEPVLNCPDPSTKRGAFTPPDVLHSRDYNDRSPLGSAVMSGDS
ncbi:hypothetical protein KIPB_012546, partial [Kipferlia bialata]